MGPLPVVLSTIMSNAKPFMLNGVQVCYDYDETGMMFVGMYTSWMLMTSYCIYIVFKRYERGLEIIYSPQLQLHLWVNKMIVPALCTSTLCIVILSITGCTAAYLIDPEINRHRPTFEVLMVNIYLLDYFVNSFIMYYTIYGIFPVAPESPTLVWIAFPGVPAVQIPRSCMEANEYLRQFEISDPPVIAEITRERESSNIFQLSIENHDRLMDYVMSQEPIADADNSVEYNSDEHLNYAFRGVRGDNIVQPSNTTPSLFIQITEEENTNV